MAGKITYFSINISTRLPDEEIGWSPIYGLELSRVT
jgi:hypothetical protein